VNRTFALLAAVTLVSCGKQGGVDTTPIQGTWQRDDEATMRSLIASLPEEYLAENGEIYFGMEEAVLTFTDSKITLPNWGVTCDYKFDGTAVKVFGCSKKAKDGTAVMGMEGSQYEYVDGKLLFKDLDKNVVAIFVKANAPATAVAADGQVDAAQQGAVEEEPMEESDEDIRARQCTVTYRGATAESYSPEAVAEYQAECPGYDLPIAWQEAANVEADAGSEATDVDACVEGKIQAYRAEMGEDAMVRQDMLDEWEAECVAAQ